MVYMGKVMIAGHQQAGINPYDNKKANLNTRV